MQIMSMSHRYSCRYIVYNAGVEEQGQTFNYTSPESPTNNFSVNLYTWSRPNLNKKMVVTSCKYGLYRIMYSCRYIVYDAGLKNNVKLSIIPHPNRPRIIFPSTSIHGHIQNLNKKMVVTSCKYGLYRISIHADILYTTQALKNNVKLSIIPHPNRPRIIFPSTSNTWSRPKSE